MNAEAEFDVLRQQWQSDTAVPQDLRRTVERQSRLMKLGLVGDTAVTVVIGGGMTVWAVRSPEMLPVAIATWFFLAAAWTMSFRINRGNWTASASDTAAFLDLSIRRCRSALATIRFACALFVSEIVFSLGWIYNHSIRGHQSLWTWLFFSSFLIDLVCLGTLAFFGAVTCYRRKKTRELESFLNLRGEIVGLEANPAGKI
jgi:hypothetical protein